MCTVTGMDGNWLREYYLVGVNLVDRNGIPFPEGFYTNAITAAKKRVESDLGGIAIDPVTIAIDDPMAKYDCIVTTPPRYLMQVRKRPIIEVLRWQFRWGNLSTIEVPLNIVNVRANNQVELVQGFGSVYGVGWLGVWPGVFWNPVSGFWWHHVSPDSIRISHRAGYDGEVPPEISDLVGLWASIMVLMAAGRAIAQGLSGRNVSQDGLSQSFNFANGGAQVFAKDIETYRSRYYENLAVVRASVTGIQCAAF